MGATTDWTLCGCGEDRFRCARNLNGPGTSAVLCKHKLLLWVLFSIQHQNDPVKTGITPHHSCSAPRVSLGRKSQVLSGRSCVRWSLHPSRLYSVPATGTALPQGLSPAPLPEPAIPREPHSLFPRFTQISSSQSSNITFSMRSSLTTLLKVKSKHSPFLSFCLILLPSTSHHLICYILYLFMLFTICLFPLDYKPQEYRFFFFWSICSLIYSQH